MNVHELNADQLRQLKERYLIGLADDGHYAETMQVDYDEPSYWDIYHAEELVPNEWLYEQWEGHEFSEGDFIEEKKMPPKDTEEFLRKHFGLKGEFYSEEYKEYCKAHENDPLETFSDEWYDTHEDPIEPMYTREANEAWYKASALIRDLEEMGYIPTDCEHDFHAWLIENVPE